MAEQHYEPEMNVRFLSIPRSLEPDFKAHFPMYPNGLWRTNIDGYVCNPYMGRKAINVFKIKPRSDDIWIRTFPRSGTTWMSEIVWLLVNDLDYEKAKNVSLTFRSPNIDGNYMNNWDVHAPKEFSEHLMTAEKIEQMQSDRPRVLKSHFPTYMLPTGLINKCKTIFVSRNPKDALVSLYFFHKLVKMCSYTGDIETFAEYFMNDLVAWTPYFNNVKEAWALRNHPNMHFVFYEDMKKDLKSEIRRLAKFLNKEITEEQLDKLTEHSRIDKFQKNEAVNYSAEIKAGMANEGHQFVRKGKAGDWKNHFSPEMVAKLDAWIAKNLQDTDLRFVEELDQQD